MSNGLMTPKFDCILHPVDFLRIWFLPIVKREFFNQTIISYVLLRVVTLFSVVPLKIGKNNCKPGETYRKTPSICKIPTLTGRILLRTGTNTQEGDYRIFGKGKKEWGLEPKHFEKVDIL